MPVILKGHSWSQDSDHVTIRVPFPDNHLCRDEVFTSLQLLKINKAPYYWEVLLRHPVVEEDSRCLLLENEVIFSLRKQEIDLEWDRLELECTKSERTRLKEELLAGHQKRMEERAKQRAIEKDQKKRDEVSKQIERDGNTRTEIENLLEESKRQEMERMEQSSRKDTPRPKKFKKHLPKSEPIHELPSVRQSATVTVNFSKRNFITPKRESMEHDEQQWTMKQAAAKKAVGFVDEDLRPEERNPEWLKQKGDTFFQQQNYLAAISAYTAGIRLTKEYYSLFLNRSAAHFALENYQRCAEDCSTALELLSPPIEANRKARVSCLARRGAALTKLGYLRQGCEELIAACKLDPQNNELRREAEMLQRKMEECDTESE
ncbi:dynein axonemal assembly factor 4 [Topomyia yanbarensis]|uniref:dynein axonemal assembly factor 4 n=1 Tax=Topomyia yanbarensis TaxID=2498891 RepID=UPI00273AFAE9|nr:dynein axonemal assembly factor 4 [Topomyia yanbarensis]